MLFFLYFDYIQSIQNKIMKPDLTLHTKFKSSLSMNDEVSKVPVASSLDQFLKEEEYRIQRVMQKKHEQIRKVERVATASLEYREELKRKISDRQIKNEQNKRNFLQKRVKTTKFQLKEVDRVRSQHEQKLKSKKNDLITKFQENKEDMRNFWSYQSLARGRKYSRQGSASPLYQLATARKKHIEKRSQNLAEEAKDHLMIKHTKVKQNVQSPIRDKIKRLHDHQTQVNANLAKNYQIISTKQSRNTTNFCFKQNRSSHLLKKNQKQYVKKMKGKLIDRKQHLAKTQQNFIKRQKEKAESLKDGRHRMKWEQNIGYQTNSNGQEKRITKSQQNHRMSPFSNLRSSLTLKNQKYYEAVKINKEIIHERQERKDEKKLMIERQISNAIQIRSEIKNQSNCLVRKLKFNFQS